MNDTSVNETLVDQPLHPASSPAFTQTPDELLLPENPAEGLLGPEDWHDLAAQLQLSSRELCVAVLMFEGLSRYQIERRLGIAESTVRVYIDRMFTKLSVKDRLGMALRIMRVHLGNHLLKPPIPRVAEKCDL